MVQVIDRMEDAGGAECIKFRVYRSPRDPNRILANWQHGVSEHGMASIGTSQLGVPVGAAVGGFGPRRARSSAGCSGGIGTRTGSFHARVG